MKTVLGCVIDPDWDDDGLVSEALFTLNQAQAGVLFALDTVFDSDGTPLVGPLATDSA
ncbi:MAG: hypothetical protein JXJ20_08460 [Anaerolineae bacterium]|nr:hypothetical protein [Anaerolineae bacterium]